MRYLPIILLIVLAIYCWIELAQSDPAEVRLVPRGLWALVIFLPLIGPVSWLVYGRPNGTEPPPRQPARSQARSMAPDDDVDFLRSLKIDPPSDN